MKKIFTLILCGTTLTYAHSQVVISQIYGGGGNSAASYKNDFVELFNSSNTDISLNGYSVQYATATGSFNAIAPLSGNIKAYRHYLIQFGATGVSGDPGLFLPTPEATYIGTNSNIAVGAGKVVLSNSTDPVTFCPTTNSFPNSILDFVGYGSTANCKLNASAQAPTGNVNSISRINSGFTNNQNNSTDFAVSTANPRNGEVVLLPLQLLSFSASPKESNIAFSWKTANEHNTHHFEIEQSFDGTSFKSIATVAAAGNSTTEKSYSYTRSLNAATTFYRLKIVDVDGKSSTSSVVKVAPSKTGFSLGNVYPIPAKSKVTVEWNSKVAGATTLTLTDISGRTIKTLNLQSTQGFNQYNLDVNALTSGQYFLRLKNDMNQLQTIITKQ